MASVFCEVSKFWLCHLLALCNRNPQEPRVPFPLPISCHCLCHLRVPEPFFTENSPSKKPLSSSGVVWASTASDWVGQMLYRTCRISQVWVSQVSWESFSFIVPATYRSLVSSSGDVVAFTAFMWGPCHLLPRHWTALTNSLYFFVLSKWPQEPAPYTFLLRGLTWRRHWAPSTLSPGLVMLLPSFTCPARHFKAHSGLYHPKTQYLFPASLQFLEHSRGPMKNSCSLGFLSGSE